MTIEQIAGLSLTLVVMFIGLLGSILPGLPSTPVVMLAAIGHRLYFGETGASNLVMALLALMMLLSVVMDYLAAMYGAKRLGATWKGITGAVVGALIGLFFGFFGILIGPFLGAMAFEMAGGREHKDAARAGLGATLGLLAGAIGKIACCVAMMGTFAINVVYRSLNAV